MGYYEDMVFKSMKLQEGKLKSSIVPNPYGSYDVLFSLPRRNERYHGTIVSELPVKTGRFSNGYSYTGSVEANDGNTYDLYCDNDRFDGTYFALKHSESNPRGTRIGKISKGMVVKESLKKSKDSEDELYKKIAGYVKKYDSGELDIDETVKQILGFWEKSSKDNFNKDVDNAIKKTVHKKKNESLSLKESNNLKNIRTEYDKLETYLGQWEDPDDIPEEAWDAEERYYELQKILDKYKKRNESLALKEDWTHFEFTSGSNPYIATTEKEKNRMLKKYKGKIQEIKPGFYKVNDKNLKESLPEDYNLDDGKSNISLSDISEAILDVWDDDSLSSTLKSTIDYLQYFETNYGWKNIDLRMFNDAWEMAASNSNQDDAVNGYVTTCDGDIIDNQDDAVSWLESKLNTYGSTYFFPECDKITLDKLVGMFGSTYFWR